MFTAYLLLGACITLALGCFAFNTAVRDIIKERPRYNVFHACVGIALIQTSITCLYLLK